MIREFLIVTFAARIVNPQPIALPSITVFAVVMVIGPVYWVTVTPLGTPVFPEYGYPHCASFGMQLLSRVPGGTDTVGLGGGVVTGGVGLGVGLADADGVGLGVGDALAVGDGEVLGLGVTETDGDTEGEALGDALGEPVGVGPGMVVGIPFTRQFRTSWKLPSESFTSVDAGSHSTVGLSVVTVA